jgi:glycosyltransferase involved in cell wall biosynthesis
VEDGVNGYLVPVKDGHALAKAIRRVLDDQCLANCMGAAGREKALAAFDERLVFDRTMNVYGELLPDIHSAR